MTFSIGSAVGSGFALFGRRPLSVIGWGFLFVVSALLGQFLAFALFGVAGFAGEGESGAAGIVGAQIGRSLVPLLVTVPVSAMISAALNRAVLNPGQRVFLSFGEEERALLWLNLLFIPIGVVIGILAVLVIALVAGLSAALHGVIGSIGSGLLIGVFSLGFGLALMWLALRFSMAPAMTFVDRRVRLLASWEVTRGQGWRLFGLAWLLVLVGLGLLLAIFVVLGIMLAVMAGVGAGMGGLNVQSLARGDPSAFSSLGPLIWVMLVVFFLLYGAIAGFFVSVFQAPWADVYRQMRGNTDVSAAFS